MEIKKQARLVLTGHTPFDLTTYWIFPSRIAKHVSYLARGLSSNAIHTEMAVIGMRLSESN